jgi:signal transduction histidine kinase
MRRMRHASPGRLHQLKAADDHREQVVKIMRQASGQLADGLHLLALAHDFNNLLAVIIGSLELVEPNAQDAPRLTRALKAAGSEAPRVPPPSAPW